MCVCVCVCVCIHTIGGLNGIYILYIENIEYIEIYRNNIYSI